MKNTSRIFILSTLLTSASPLLADEASGRIVLVGRGSASHAPEYVSFDIAVTSICYNTSQEAASANAKLANEILKTLETFKQSERDKVTASGGANVRQTETTYVGSETKVLCERKWRSENHLHIEMAKTTELPDLQDKLMIAVSTADTVDTSVVAQTYAEVGRPVFGLYPETSLALRNKAQGLAFQDAKSQLAALTSECAFVGPKLISMTPPEYSIVAKRGLSESAPANAGSAPVIPSEMEVSATLKMEWSFTPSAACRF